MPGMLRLLTRLVILAAAVAAVTYGLLAWQHEAFTLEGLWLFDNGWRAHPLHFLVIGIGLIPPVMWEIFAMDLRAARRRLDDDRGNGDG